MKEPKDKRTKAWREWKSNFDNDNSIGLGDVIDKVTTATGIKKAVEFIAGEDCGCNERKQKINKKVRIKWANVRCFNEDQYNYWTKFRTNKSNEVTQTELKEIRNIMLQLFAVDIGKPSCCVEPYINEINKVYEAY